MFGKAIHSLSKIGDELYLEPLDHGVCILFYQINTHCIKFIDIYMYCNSMNLCQYIYELQNVNISLQLALRTVNACRSAYACFLFAPSFFTHYEDGSDIAPANNTDDEALKCKIGMKVLFAKQQCGRRENRAMIISVSS